jgi:hypothetical protein
VQSAYLTKYFPEGSAFLMGPLSGDHWLVFVADYVDRDASECVDRTLDMMMFGIDQEVAKLFTKDTARFPKDSDVTKASGIDTLLPGSSIQEFCFEPCGYSMNGLIYDAYWTIHITPESHCSYASFETNIRMKDYSSLVKAVLAIFRPTRFTMTLFADDHGLVQLNKMPFEQVVTVPLVETQAQAIMGPCVQLADGNTVYPGSGGSPRAAADAAAAAAAAASSGGDPVVAASSAASTASTASSPPPDEPAAVPAAAAAPAATAPAATKRAGSPTVNAPAVIFGRRGAMSYVASHKSSSEFMGYSCFMSNYRLVTGSGQGAVGSTTKTALGTVPDAAVETLSMPRAKYVVSQRLEQMKQRLRTESL